MIGTGDIRNAYNYLYEQIRNYIWGFPVIEKLADVEVGCYSTCPDVLKIRSDFAQLNLLIRDVAKEDEELQKAVDNFSELINSSDEAYAKLLKVDEEVKSI